jgi:hypothetical protein
MSIKLNLEAFDHAKELIANDHVVTDESNAWREHRPSTEKEDDFIRQHGLAEYAKWHLGIDDREQEVRKNKYKFPYGDFKNVHRCGVLTVERTAGESEYYEIEIAAADLHAILDSKAR